MTMISRRILNQELEKYIFELFIKSIGDLRDPEEIKNFLEDLLSPTERIMLVKRLSIAILLEKNYTYEQISQILKVSSPTINKVGLTLKIGASGYQKVVSKIIKGQKKEELADKIEEILIELSPEKRYGSIAYEKKRQEGKELITRRRRRSLL
ncbi:MAG: YerC/YecD family TrpR-related protein [Patescibacteria group bacterium]|nr:YerC/YecD family TrpR-related protein [Patescibacteria group bacterium]